MALSEGMSGIRGVEQFHFFTSSLPRLYGEAKEMQLDTSSFLISTYHLALAISRRQVDPQYPTHPNYLELYISTYRVVYYAH